MSGASRERVLGIETSCDETAAAVVEDGRRILSNVVASQVHVHAAYGGVVPELASRHHIEAIAPVVEAAMAEAQTRFEDLAAVAVTQGPGLVGSLLVGLQAAKAIALRARQAARPRAPRGGPRRGGVPRARRHPAAGRSARRLGRAHEPLRRARGGHTPAARAAPATTRPARPSTRSRSCWGSAIPAARSSTASRASANDRAVEFTVARIKDGRSDFSFSGIKTAVLLHVRREGIPPVADPADVPKPVRDLVASFQRTVVDALVGGLAKAAGTTARAA